MQILQKFILNFGLFLCIFQVNAIEQEVRHITKYWSLPENATAYGQDSSEETDRFLYSICKKSNSSFYSCNIISESWPFKDGTVKDICDINIFTGNEENVSSFYEELYIINKVEVLLVLTQVLNIRTNHSSIIIRNIYNIIDRKDCEIKSSVTINSENDITPTTPIIYKNSFTFIAADKDLCGNNRQCLITYDWKNNQNHVDSIGSGNNVILLYSVSPFSSDKGYYLWTSNSFDKTQNEFSKVDQYHMNEHGNINKLVTIDPVYFDLYNIFVLSNANEQQSICWKLDDDIRKLHPEYYSYSKRIRCVQTDTRTMKLNVTLELPEHINWVAVYNLKEGGMLVATGLCSPLEGSSKSNEVCREINIFKINDVGKKNQMIRLGGFELNCRKVPAQLKSDILENENEFCFVLVCGNRIPNYGNINLGYHKTCIKKEYLSFLREKMHK